MRFAPLRALRALYDHLTQRVSARRLITGDSSAGVLVSHTTAMALTVYARCVGIIAGDVSCLDLQLYRRRGDGGKELAALHPHWSLWTLRPAPYLTRQRWLECLMGHVLTRGNGYSEIEFRNGRQAALHPIDPGAIELAGLYQDQPVYAYQHPQEGRQAVPGSRVLHIRGYTEDGLTGVAPLRIIRNTLGLAIAQENYGASLFKNGAVPKGVLTYPGTLSDDDWAALKQSFERNHMGDNQNRFAILDRGLKWESTGINPDEAQFLESRKYSRAEIAGWFGVPLHRLNDTERATWANVESLGLDYVIYTLTPWITRLEQEINAQFYPDGEYFVEFNFDSLARGDSAARANYYRTLFGMGALTLDEIRRREGMNPVPGVGAIHWIPLNIAPAEDVLENPDVGQQSAQTRALTEYLQRMLPHLPVINPAGPATDQARAVAEDAARRVVRKETRALAGAIDRHLTRDKDLHAFTGWAEKFYREQRDYFAAALGPAAALLGTADQLDRAADQYVRAAASQISDRLLDVPALRAWAAQREAQTASLIAPLISREMASA